MRHLKKKRGFVPPFLSTTQIHRCFGGKVEANQQNTTSEFSKYQKKHRFQSIKIPTSNGPTKKTKNQDFQKSFHLCHCPSGNFLPIQKW